METSPQYNNPYTNPGQASGVTNFPRPASTMDSANTMQPVSPINGMRQQTMAEPPRSKSNWLLMLVFLLLGLVLGAAAGYFAAQLLIFGPRLDQSDTEKSQLESRVAVLEDELARAQGSATPSPTTPGTTTPGTGTAPTATGITPDPTTSNWSTYTNAQYHLSFKYPADYQVQEEPATDAGDERLARLVIRRTGETEIAGFVDIYPAETAGGPTMRDIVTFYWPDRLPTTIKNKSAGAGQTPDITELAVVLNGTQATKLSAQEGRNLEATPGGQTYTGYLIENQFNQTYLIGGCTTDQTAAGGLVGCPFTTTVTVLR